MKIFDSGDGWGSKVNFIDKNNVLVGYDTLQDGCENAGWFISDDEKNDINNGENKNNNVDGYSFDTSYFVEVEASMGHGDGCLEAGGMVRFKLTSKNKPNLYLHIYNSHNGCYGHGFTATISEKGWQSGTL